MFVHDAAKPLVSVVPGVQRKTLAVGEHTLMSKFVLEAGSELPLQSGSLMADWQHFMLRQQD